MNDSNILKIIALIFSISYCALYCIYRPISDPDSYYHAAAAISVAKNNNFNPALSLPLTIFNKLPNDQHYGYHLLQSRFSSNLEELKIFQAILSSFAICLFFIFAIKLDKKYAIWLLMLLISSYGFMNRVSIIKASALSVSFFISLIYGLCYTNFLLIFLSTFLFTLCHSAFLICFFVIISYIICKKQAAFRGACCAVVGVLTALATHPDKLNYIKFLYFQGVEVALLKNLSSSIPIGEEWLAPSFKKIFISNLPIIIAIIFALIHIIFNYKNFDFVKKFTFLIFICCTALYFHSERFIEYAIPSSLLLLGSIIKHLDKRIILASSIFAIIWTPLGINAQTKRKEMHLPLNLVNWIKDNSEKDSMICNLDWTDYPNLLLNLPDRKFIYGSDPRYLAFENKKIYQSIANYLKSPEESKLVDIKNLAKCELILTKIKPSQSFKQFQEKRFEQYYLLSFLN